MRFGGHGIDSLGEALTAPTDGCRVGGEPRSRHRALTREACHPFGFQGPTEDREIARTGDQLAEAVRRCRGLHCLDQGLLELVACTKESKEHESIVVIDAKPMHVHTALLLLGANPGNPAMRKQIGEKGAWLDVRPGAMPWTSTWCLRTPMASWSSAPLVISLPDPRIYPMRLGFNNDGADEDSKFPRRFLFAGSQLVESGPGPRKYLSGLSGNVISIATFGDELLCLPGIQSRDTGSLMWEIDPTHLPDVGSKVTLRLRPQITPDAKTRKALPEN